MDEIARNSVESQRLSSLIGYATAAPFAIGFLETALAIEDSSNGIWRWPITLRNCRSATSNPEPTPPLDLIASPPAFDIPADRFDDGEGGFNHVRAAEGSAKLIRHTQLVNGER